MKISPADRSSIDQLIDQVRPFLPSQGPLEVFIHHNTLHAFEDVPFEQALEQAGQYYGAEAYITEAKALGEYERGRIDKQSLVDIIRKELPISYFLGSIDRLLLTPLELISNEELKWFLKKDLGAINSEYGLLDFYNKSPKASVRDKWLRSFQLARQLYSLTKDRWITEKPPVLELPLEVRTLLIKICASYLDRGLAAWELPQRVNGLIPAFCSLLFHGKQFLPSWLKVQAEELNQFLSSRSLDQIVEFELDKIEISKRLEFIKNSVFKLKGWSGIFATLEENPALLRDDIPVKPSLKEFLALLMVLERVYFDHSRDIRSASSSSISHLSSMAWFFQRLVNENPELKYLTAKQDLELIKLLSELNSTKRRKIWHLAYERSLENQFTSALILHKPYRSVETAQYQIVCCIDDREGSFRRYIEELGPKYQTFGAAGFFGIDALVKALHQVAAPYCPVAVKPSREIVETTHRTSRSIGSGVIAATRAKLGHVPHRFVRSWLLSFMGVFSFLPLLVGIIFPQIFGRIAAKRRGLREQSELEVFNTGGDELGYTAGEAADRLEKLFLTIGLSKHFGALVIFVGHGSHSRNNPFRSAYDCGACGGRPGRFNARAAALLANQKEVRTELRSRGILIPDSSVFIGCYHNTATDELEWYDIEQLSENQKLELSLVRSDLAIAARMNAEERCRRFRYRSIKSEASAELEVLFRSESIAEPRPEYGHATNAFCVVGKRELTRGLFLDRRAFLVSYDKELDPEGLNLRALLAAIVPVCGGICLEYFFSTLDNSQYGAGTKLPHNIVSLLGVMNGYSGDLRTGLPAQMVEIHEAVRLVMVVDCSREQLSKALEDIPSVRQIFDNGWIKLIRRDQQALWQVTGSEEQEIVATHSLPSVDSWSSWIEGKNASLGFCEIKPASQEIG